MTTTRRTMRLLGVDFNRTDTDPQFALNTPADDNLGGVWTYSQATAAITGAGYVCQITAAGAATMTNTTISDAQRGLRLGVPAVAFAINEYGWLQVHGPCEAIRVAASCVGKVKLNTTATDGVLDDDASAGAENADGVTITTTVTGAAAASGNLIEAAIGATL